jgi:hypothetical protein
MSAHGLKKGLTSGAKEVAEKQRTGGEIEKYVPQGLKPQ